jgi:hypothetical protein
VRAVNVARELGTIKKRFQDQICFEDEITRTKATTPKTFLGSIPDEDDFFSSGTNHDGTAQRTLF